MVKNSQLFWIFWQVIDTDRQEQNRGEIGSAAVNTGFNTISPLTAYMARTLQRMETVTK